MADAKQAKTAATADYVEAPTRVRMYAPQTIGERIADHASAAIGSWKFIIIQTGLVIVWVVVNLTGFLLRWDPYPFILLNLMFSVQAAYTGPILLLAGNRQASKDRALAERDDAEIGMLLKLQQEQCAVLGLLKDAQAKHTQILEMLHSRGVRAPESPAPVKQTPQAGTARSAKAVALKT
jgi:uncharacterized membrane protein